MSLSQREQLRDSLRSSAIQQREISREQIWDMQRTCKCRHSESDVTFSTQHDTTVPSPRKQGARVEIDDDDDDNDLNDSNNHTIYSTDDALKDCDKITSLTTKLCRVESIILIFEGVFEC